MVCACLAGSCVLLAGLAARASEKQPELDAQNDTVAVSQPDVAGGVVLPDLPEAATNGWSGERQALAEEVVRAICCWYDGDPAAVIDVYGKVGNYTLCRLHCGGGDEACVFDWYQGYGIYSASVGYPSSTYLYLIGDSEVYTLHAACREGLVPDMAALYALLPADMQMGYDPDHADTLGVGKSYWGGDDGYGFTDGVWRTCVS